MEERRCVARWQINKNAELKIEGGIKPIPCVVEDISICGTRLSLQRDLFPEVFSSFNLALSDNFEFNVGGRVVWSEKAYEKNIYGLSFDKIEDTIKNRMTQYIKDNFPGEMIKQVWGGI